MNLQNDNDMVLTIKDIMEALHIGRVTAYNLIKSGELKATKIAGKYRTTKTAINEYLENAVNMTGFNDEHSSCYNTVDCFYGTRKIPSAERSDYFE